MTDPNSQNDARPSRRGLWIALGIAALFFGLTFFAYMRDDALDDFSGLAPTPPLTPAADSVFDEWRKVYTLADEPAFEAETDRQFFERLDGILPWQQEPVTKILSANGRMIEAAIAADTLGALRFPVRHSIKDPIDYLGEIQFIAKILKLHTADRRHAKDFDAASRSAQLGLRFADRAASGSGGLIEVLVAITCGAISHSAIDQLVADLPEALLLELDNALASEPNFGPIIQRCLRQEFQGYVEGFNSPDEIAGFFDDHAIVPSLQYRPNRTINASAEYFRQLIAQATLAPHARSIPPNPPVPEGLERLSSNAVGRTALAMGTSVFESIINKADHLLAYRRALRIKIALVRYQREHGTLPNSLASLVPHYLPALPADPYSGESLYFDQVRGAVWCAGENLVDDGGATDHKPGFGRADDLDPTLWIAPPEIGPEPEPKSDSRSRGAKRRSRRGQ